jgi:hypothetical protein
MLSQNIEFGFLEGIVRGYKGELLKTQDYANLLQCDSIDGVKRRTISEEKPIVQFYPYLSLSDYLSLSINL